jgi:hypothetical protein
MIHYRLYYLDGGGRISSALDLECADDADALATLQEYADGRPMELWQAGRRVLAWHPAAAAPTTNRPPEPTA